MIKCSKLSDGYVATVYSDEGIPLTTGAPEQETADKAISSALKRLHSEVLLQRKLVKEDERALHVKEDRLEVLETVSTDVEYE